MPLFGKGHFMPINNKVADTHAYQAALLFVYLNTCIYKYSASFRPT